MANINESEQEQILKARREYYKKYRAEHKEQIKVYQNRWWLKRAKQAKEIER